MSTYTPKSKHTMLAMSIYTDTVKHGLAPDAHERLDREIDVLAHTSIRELIHMMVDDAAERRRT